MQEQDRFDQEQLVGEEDNEEAGSVEGWRALQPDARRQHCSEEEKAWIVQESFEQGTTVEEVARRHGVPHRRLSFWRRRARRRSPMSKWRRRRGPAMSVRFRSRRGA